MHKLISKTKQKGATLLELVMFIGLAALILIGGVSWYITASEGQRISDEVSNVNAITALVRNTYTTQNNFSGLTNSVITRSSQFPDKMRIAGDTSRIKSGWENNGVALAPATILVANDAFTITYLDVPEGPCIDFATRTFRFYERTRVNATVITSVANVATACVAGDNDIEFRTR
jgi:hypothetical protein